ncbi:helix-turn-helix transcriptional regulator [Thermocoleostomius sinensis]|uniref:Transcriptional regulator n=1 Tax=Thermocoleostomius sinensis A174 TaxID=2016057 RepID=A0A9E8ZEA6_9CYAN|nr:metalloregulator ArsR/SmtB family transcription factor [Thermocoleostomius sinensis]WAL61765.1 transcriptional regulator [Thermocoleostomius sinensis A174]
MGDDRQGIKHQILHLLKRQGAQTATALADQLQVSPMAIRQHLQSLKAEQWVTYQEERRPLGRPVKLWQLTPQSGQWFPDSHTELLVDILCSIKAMFGADGIDRLMLDRSQRQTQTYRSKVNEWSDPNLGAVSDLLDWQRRVNALAHLRTQEGYMAEVVEQPEGALLLIENHCPICAAAQICQNLCSTELEVFRAVLGATVTVERVEHILQGDRRCTYRIQG